MDITKDFIKAKQPCSSGLRWFLRHYENGSNYQPLLDALVDAGRADDASWLLTQFGPTSEVRIVDDIDTQAVVFAGRLEVRGTSMSTLSCIRDARFAPRGRLSWGCRSTAEAT
jgi:hypothetical protein